MYHTPELDLHGGRSKFYCLDFFPYPSGHGLSVGHGRNYVPTDVIARYHRMRGDAVLHPMGWDAFGLPAENEAVKRGIHPQVTTTRYAANYRRQMILIGCSYDWEREINSSAPEFYRWTQWFFSLLYRRGLAYRASGRQWWCPGCRTVLANEQVDAQGVCWRGHAGVHKRDLEQWYFRITAYAEELLAGLDELDWPEHILTMQRNWIGRTEGVEFALPVAGSGESVVVYTTRPETVYGVSFLALAPEHPLAQVIVEPGRRAAIDAYIAAAARHSDVDRQTAGGGPDGVFTGAYVVNPANRERVPVYVADYVLMAHGSGAVMGVPAHDDRDYAFAARFDLPIRTVIAPVGDDEASIGRAYTGAGVMVDSGQWSGLPSVEAATGIGEWLIEHAGGRRVVKYRLRDWLISRQRYWGAPIPIIYCRQCGIVPVPEADLPILLPETQAWLPGEGGRSPLANIAAFVNTRCPQCGGAAERETDTMDGFACSSWYFLRFVSPHYAQGPFDPEALAYWGRPDIYVGGAEHAVMHLLYARFWTRVMADAGLVPFREPFLRLRSQGVMHARDPQSGETQRMSKSAGNVVTPDSMAERYGADALRLYLLFQAPFENNTTWDETGISGARRMLERTWRLVSQVLAAGETLAAAPDPDELLRSLKRTARRVSADIESLSFNTAVAALMEGLNALAAHHAAQGVTNELAETLRVYLRLLAPFAPHVAEELWERLGGPYSIHEQPWPAEAESEEAAETAILIVQVDGRVRGKVSMAAGSGEEVAYAVALENEAVRRAIGDRTIMRTIYVQDRVLNLVTA